MCSILLITVLLFVLCAGQSTLKNTTSPAFFYTPPPTCGLCQFAAATATASSGFTTFTTTHTGAGIVIISPIASYIVFTAYSITSGYSSAGFCVTTSGLPISVVPPYSVLRPTSIPASDFESVAGSSLLHHLGFSSCIGPAENVTPTALVNGSLPSGSLLSASSASTEAPISGNSTVQPVPGSRHQTPDEQAKIGIGIAIPFVVGALLLLALLLWRRYRRNKGANAATAEHVESEGAQPYLQQKPELEAQEKRKQELDAEERRYELDGESGIHEMSDRSNNDLPASRVLQELRGEEHARELGVS